MSRRSGQSGSVERKGDWYVVRFWIDVPGQEKRTHKSVRICPVSGPGRMTKPERERRARKITEEAGANSEDHFRKVEAANLGITFRQQSEWWIKWMQDRQRRPVKARTIANWKSHLLWINEVIGDVPLADLNNRIAKELVARMRKDGYSAKTICNYFQVVAMVLASAVDDDGEQRYPRKWNREFIDLPVVDKHKQRTPSFNAEDVQQIVSQASGQERLLFALLAATGLRVGEALALECQHFADGALRVCQSVWNGELYSPKTAFGIRVVDLPSNVTEMLTAFIGSRKTGFLFRNGNGGPLHQSNVLRRSLHPILERMKREKAGFHSFRRFRITQLRKQQTPEDLLRFWVGHGDKSVTDRYSRLKDDVAFRREWADKVGAGFELPAIVPCCPPTSAEQQDQQVVVM